MYICKIRNCSIIEKKHFKYIIPRKQNVIKKISKRYHNSESDNLKRLPKDNIKLSECYLMRRFLRTERYHENDIKKIS